MTTHKPFDSSDSGSVPLTQHQIIQVLGQIPHRGYMLHNAEGSAYNTNYLTNLRTIMFSGCTFAEFGSSVSFVLHYSGKLIYGQHEGQHGSLAVANFLRDIPKAKISVLRVLPAPMRLGIAVLFGNHYSKPIPTSLKTSDVQEALALKKFSGMVVSQQSEAISTWFMREGKPFLSQPMPPLLSQGTIHLFEEPDEPDQDLLDKLQHTAQEPIPVINPSEQVWQVAKTVLNEYLGRGAEVAFEKMRKDIKENDPNSLKHSVQKRLTVVLGQSAAQQFNYLSKEL